MQYRVKFCQLSIARPRYAKMEIFGILPVDKPQRFYYDSKKKMKRKGIIIMNDFIWEVMLLIVWPIVALGGIWYLINPQSAKRFHERHPWWDRYGKMKKSSNLEIRIRGI